MKTKIVIAASLLVLAGYAQAETEEEFPTAEYKVSATHWGQSVRVIEFIPKGNAALRCILAVKSDSLDLECYPTGEEE